MSSEADALDFGRRVLEAFAKGKAVPPYLQGDHPAVTDVKQGDRVTLEGEEYVAGEPRPDPASGGVTVPLERAEIALHPARLARLAYSKS